MVLASPPPKKQIYEKSRLKIFLFDLTHKIQALQKIVTCQLLTVPVFFNFQDRFSNTADLIQIRSAQHVDLLLSWLQNLDAFRLLLPQTSPEGPVRMLDPFPEQLVTNDDDDISQPRLKLLNHILNPLVR